MWKLKSIHANNIGSFKQLDYDIQQGITTLVFGNNNDNESQKSNGSGKSFLIETIAVGITGSSLRKIKNEEIINDGESDANIHLHFTNTGGESEFSIYRQLSRNESSIVRVEMIHDGVVVSDGSTVMPGVDEYNKYILEVLGVSKEELFNTFLLSKHKYENFLSGSDKEKKEIINRFSNGVLVDQAIELLQKDKEPVEKEITRLSLELSNYEGRVLALKSQIETEQNNQTTKKNSKEQKIKELNNSIEGKRRAVREFEQSVLDVTEKIKLFTKQYNTIVEFEKGDLDSDVPGSIKTLEKMMQSYGYTLTDRIFQLSCLEENNRQLDQEQDQINKSVSKIILGIDSYRKQLELEREKYDKSVTESGNRESGIRHEIELLDQQFKELVEKGEKTKKLSDDLSGEIEETKVKLRGSVICPKCSHKFIVSDPEIDVNKLNEEIENKFQTIKGLREDIQKTREQCMSIKANKSEKNQSIEQISDDLREKRISLASISDELQKLENNVTRYRNQLESIALKVSSNKNKIDSLLDNAINEAVQKIDDCITSHEKHLEQLNLQIRSAHGAINVFSDTLKEMEEMKDDKLIESLSKSVIVNEEKVKEIGTEKIEIEQKLTGLNVQESRFVEFKTYLANMKIQSLSDIMNDFLEAIGSDLRISFSGFTVLKNNKIRDKISISLLRDGIDVGSFGKFSEGEKARINLASILAMHKLINLNCDTDKGIDLLVLDEILEAVDENGLSNMFTALNKLGVTALVVSHGNVAEGYPHILLITKTNGVSTINDCN